LILDTLAGGNSTRRRATMPRASDGPTGVRKKRDGLWQWNAYTTKVKLRCRSCNQLNDPDEVAELDGYCTNLDCIAPPYQLERVVVPGRVYGTAKTLNAAVAAREKFLRDKARGDRVDESRLTLGAFMRPWVESHIARNDLRDSTADLYRTIVRVYILPDPIATRRLQELRVNDFEDFYDRLRTGRNGRRPLKPKSIRNVHGLLHRAYRSAMRDRKVESNPLELAELPKIQRDPQSWGREDMLRFLKATEDDRLGPLWRLALATGMRRGELTALEWDDVRLDEPNGLGVVRINKAIVLVGNKEVAGLPKTDRSKRPTVIDPDTTAALKALRVRRNKERLAAGDVWAGTERLFAWESGHAMSPRAISDKFAQAVEKAGVPRITLHGLRHTHISLLAGTGAPVADVAKRVGHAHATTTLNVYTHVLTGADLALATAWQGIANGP
jgi:integrase